ncbi:thiamine phosphate synthase [Porphyromonadaceae bacterium W3.11]|nr:thiamine phosphate synthase [Porphyromonadaceae bacterium W3.11]
MNRLQFITHQNNKFDYLTGAKLALDGGCKWIQLRMKGAEEPHIIEVGTALRRLCSEYQATLIIDDRVDLVEKLDADGVHLGQKDMPIDEARSLLGPNKIIGGTANTIDEIQAHSDRGANYVGCGPFRYTTTKKNLSSILGLKGYIQLVSQMQERDITIPLIAIGGITLRDIPAILSTGVFGIAISGAILDSKDPTEMTKEFINQINSK